MAIDTLYAIQFSPVLYQLAQQKESRFASRVRRETVSNAELAYFDTVGPDDDPEQNTTRHGDTPLSDGVYGRRKVVPQEWEKGRILDKHDQTRMLANMQGATMQSFAMSFGRKKDKIIYEAMNATAYTGKDGTGTVALAAESIGINGDGTVTTLGTAAAEGTDIIISLDRLLLMMQIFNEADVDPDIAKHWVVTPQDIANLLTIEEIGSSDYNTIKALQQGKMETYAGFKFFWYNGLTAVGSAARTFAWAEDGMILAYIGDLQTEVTIRADKKNYPQIYSHMDLGAVRMEGAKVHESLHKQAAS